MSRAKVIELILTCLSKIPIHTRDSFEYVANLVKAVVL